MQRAPFQVLIYPYHKTIKGQLEHALMKRADEGYWQAIAGGGEDEEMPVEAEQTYTRATPTCE